MLLATACASSDLVNLKRNVIMMTNSKVTR
jgi:hypothetical protein